MIAPATEVFEIGGHEFGRQDATLRTVSWASVDMDVAHEDVIRAGRRHFGRDWRVPPTWTIQARTLVKTELAAQDRIAALVALWRADSLAPGVDMPLRYMLAGRWRRVHGRPGRLSLPTSDLAIMQGLADVVAEFRLTDPLHYDDVASSTTVGIVPASSSGLILPAAPPWLWSSPGVPLSRRADVGGDAPTPLAVTFRGPVSRPWVTVGGVRVDLTGSLAYDEAVTVDARTRTCLWSGGRSGSAAGLLGPRVRLADLVVPPGHHDVTFGGTDSTGTATCTVTWRAAWRSL